MNEIKTSDKVNCSDSIVKYSEREMAIYMTIHNLRQQTRDDQVFGRSMVKVTSDCTHSPFCHDRDLLLGRTVVSLSVRLFVFQSINFFHQAH